MRYPKLRELKEAIKAIFKGPYTSGFPFDPHKPYDRFRGKPEFHEADCIGCTACVQVCPSGALSFVDEGEKRRLTHRTDMCIFCGQCQLNCPTEKGIMLTHEFDLATTESRETLQNSIEKELVRCSCCSEIIAPKDQINWVAHKIGPLLFSNTSLMLFYLKGQDLSRVEDQFKKQDAGLRTDRFHMLCPRYRREAVIKS